MPDLKRKARSKCVQVLKKAGLTGEDLEAQTRALDRFLKNPVGGKTLDESVRKFAIRKLKEYENEIQNRHNLQLKSIARELEVETSLVPWSQSKGVQLGKDTKEGLLAIIRGSNRQVQGARNSVDTRQKNHWKSLISGFTNALEKDDVLAQFRSGRFEKEIMEEYYDQFKKGFKSKKDASIVKIANIIHKFDKRKTKMLNDAGALVSRTPSLMLKMSHDTRKIADATESVWIKDVSDLLDLDAMSKDLDVDLKDFMKQLYNDLATGRHMVAQAGDEGNIPVGYLSSNASLARKLSTTNRLIFKDGGAHFEYLQKYGSSDAPVRNSVLSGFEHDARNIGLMEVLGPNPRALLTKIVRKKINHLRTHDIAAHNEFNRDMVNGLPRAVDEVFKDVDGTTRIPGKPTAARIAAVARILANAVHLGNVLFRSLNDFGTIMSEAKFQGVPWAQAVNTHFQAVHNALAPGERPEFLKHLGIAQEALIGDAIGRLDAGDINVGLMSGLQQKFFKLNGMTYWNDALKSSFAMLQASHLGSHANLTLRELAEKTPKLKRLFDMFDIDEVDWEFIRKTAWADHKKRALVTPDKIDEMSDDDIIQYLTEKRFKPGEQSTEFTEAISEIKQELGQRLKDDAPPSQTLTRFRVELDNLTRDSEKRIGDNRQVDIDIGEVDIRTNRLNTQKSALLENKSKRKGKGTEETKKQRFEEDTKLAEIEAELKDLTRRRVQLNKDKETLFEKLNKDDIEQKKIQAAITREKRFSPAVIDGKMFSQEVIDKARRDLSQKMKNLYHDRNDFAVLVPGARERSAFQWGTQAGTGAGEALRFIAQFKTFPLTVYTKPLERDILAGGAKNFKGAFTKETPGDFQALAGFIAGMTVYGAVGVMATDYITKGVTQRDWSSGKSLVDAIISGGAIGLYTDIILSPYGSNSKYSPFTGLLGPVVGDAIDAATLLTGAFNDEPKAKRALRLAHNLTPGSNLFYFKKAFDYMIWWNLQEMIDPGSLVRMERALKKRTGQKHITNPREIVPRGGDNPVNILGRSLDL